MTVKQWHDLLYNLGLFGESWLFVDRVAENYLIWRAAGDEADSADTDLGKVTEERLIELLADPRADLVKIHQRLVIDVLHHQASPEEFELPPLPKIN